MRFQLFIAERNICKVIMNNQILVVFPRLCLCSPVLIVISPVCVSDPPFPPFSCQNVFVLRLFQLFAMFIVFIPSCTTCSVSSSSFCSSPESSLPELFASQTDILSTFTLKRNIVRFQSDMSHVSLAVWTQPPPVWSLYLSLFSVLRLRPDAYKQHDVKLYLHNGANERLLSRLVLKCNFASQSRVSHEIWAPAFTQRLIFKH